MNMERLKQSIVKSAKAICRMLPLVLGVILLIGLLKTSLPKEAYSAFFRFNPFIDSIIGSALGSILAGNPINSYIIGGELLEQGVGLMAVTAFLVAWVTVGIVQLPAESILLGKKFAITRNILSFIFSILVAIVTVLVISL